MNCDSFIKELDDYLDSALSLTAARALEVHAAACAACADTLGKAKRLQREAFTLPAEHAPSRDLWPGIAARLEPRRPAASEPRPWLRALAASVAVIGVFVAGMLADRVLREQEDRTWAKNSIEQRATARGLPSVEEARRLLPAAHVALIEGGSRGGLEGGTEQELLRNLLVVNLAIQQVETAAASDPANASLRELLADLYLQENGILSQAERLRVARPAPTRTSI